MPHGEVQVDQSNVLGVMAVQRTCSDEVQLQTVAVARQLITVTASPCDVL